MDLVNSLLIPLLIVVLLAGGIWLVVELVLTVRRARVTVDSASEVVKSANELVVEAKTQLEPALARIDPMLEQIQPAAARIDPLVERAQLTLDAANVEIMRIDQIIGDVSKVSGVAGKAASSVDTITQAPANLVAGAIERLRGSARQSRRRSEALKAIEKDAALPQAGQSSKDAKADDGVAQDAAPLEEAAAQQGRRRSFGHAPQKAERFVIRQDAQDEPELSSEAEAAQVAQAEQPARAAQAEAETQPAPAAEADSAAKAQAPVSQPDSAAESDSSAPPATDETPQGAK